LDETVVRLYPLPSRRRKIFAAMGSLAKRLPSKMATNGRNRHLEPAYKQHAVVDDVCGVVLDVELTTGQTNEDR
jgi:hypothetical protein